MASPFAGLYFFHDTTQRKLYPLCRMIPAPREELIFSERAVQNLTNAIL